MMKLVQLRRQRAQKVQRALAEIMRKERWFGERLRSIEEERLKLEEESRVVRRRGDLRRERELEEFLDRLVETYRALEVKRGALADEISTLQQELEKETRAWKMVEKLEEQHYNRRLRRRSIRDEAEHE